METKSRRVDLLLQPSVYDAIKEYAEANGQSVNDYVNRILKTSITREMFRNANTYEGMRKRRANLADYAVTELLKLTPEEIREFNDYCVMLHNLEADDLIRVDFVIDLTEEQYLDCRNWMLRSMKLEEIFVRHSDVKRIDWTSWAQAPAPEEGKGEGDD